jgi:DNA-binding NtrC family response regulator
MPVAHTSGIEPGRADGDAPDRTVSVLAISSHEEDHVVLKNIFSHSNWRLRCAKSLREARAWLQAHATPVVVCDAYLPDGKWNEMLAQAQSLPGQPLLVVTSRSADDTLWAEVLNLGGYDVLMKPFEHSEVVRVLSLAWLNWKSNREAARRKGPGVAAVPALAAASA